MPALVEFSSEAGHVVNGDLAALGDAAEGIREAGERALVGIKEAQAVYVAPPPQELDARADLAARTRQALGVDISAEELRAAYASHYALLDRGPETFVTSPIALGLHPLHSASWWWGSTHWWVPTDLLGLAVHGADDGVHFTGQLNWDDGDLWKGSAGMTAVFGIDSHRLPPPGLYRSQPSVNLAGQMWGFTGINGPWEFGDNWAKCWLNTHQRVSIPGGPVLAEGHRTDTIIFFEDSGSHGVQALPGSYLGPEVFFDVDGHSLICELEVRLDLQLEGTSAVRFGTYEGWREAICGVPQWRIRWA